MAKLKLERRDPPPRAGQAASVSYALTRGAKVLGVGGVVEVRPGVWQFWSEPGAMTRAAWGYVLRIVRELRVLLMLQGANRFELYVDCDSRASWRLAARLGFRPTLHYGGPTYRLRLLAWEP